jgi:hypothetical protein
MEWFASIVIAAFCDSGNDPLPTSLREEYPFPAATADAEDPEPQRGPPLKRPASSGGLQFSIGPVGGYLKAHDADRGTWFAGAQARLHFTPVLALEVSGTYHQNHYEQGDIAVTQYPVQISGLIYPLPSAVVSPYIVGGAGWYYSRIGYSGALSGFSDQTKHPFGLHGGAGVDLKLGRFTLDADFRYIFLDSSGTQVPDGDFNYWQATLGVSINF